MPNIIPPVPFEATDTEDAVDTAVWQQFFVATRDWINQPPVYANSVDPTVNDILPGKWSVWKNTTSGVVRLWTNDGGVLKSVTLT